ncbi:MAG TPA: hypothetical protein VM901_11465 [Bdellovibrionota bacterium]|jgi:hypothetical protein|nr:hypothetical protein [Bdellovibrionota bacterium]
MTLHPIFGRPALIAISFSMGASLHASDSKPEVNIPIVENTVMHGTAAMASEALPVKANADSLLLEIVTKTRAAENTHELKKADHSGCTWVKSGNEDGNEVSQNYQLFMGKMFIKHMCSPVSPVTLRKAPFGPLDAMASKENRTPRTFENGKPVQHRYAMDKDSLENLIPLFALMYTHGQRETGGNPAEEYDPITVSKKQWNLEQGLFHAASNTLSYSATVNHPEMVRIYSEYIAKLSALAQNHALSQDAKEARFEELCQADRFTKYYQESVGKTSDANAVVTTSLVSANSQGRTIAWKSAQGFLGEGCVKKATSFLGKVDHNLRQVVENKPELAALVEEHSYQAMIQSVENLRAQIEDLETRVKASRIDLNLATRQVENETTVLRNIQQKMNDIGLALRDGNAALEGHRATMDRVISKNINGRNEVPEYVHAASERDRLLKEIPVMKAKLDGLIAQIQPSGKKLAELAQRQAEAQKKYDALAVNLSTAKQSNVDYTNMLNEAKQEANTMAFFSLDNTEYDKSTIGVSGYEDETAICFGALESFCPAFSVDYHAVNLRTNRAQFGALHKTPKGMQPACSNMFEEIFSKKDEFCKVDSIVVNER